MVYYRYLPASQTKATEEEGKETGAEAAVGKGDVGVEVDI